MGVFILEKGCEHMDRTTKLRISNSINALAVLTAFCVLVCDATKTTACWPIFSVYDRYPFSSHHNLMDSRNCRYSIRSTRTMDFKHIM